MPSDFHRIIRRQYAHLKQISGWSLWFDQPMDKAERQAIWVLLTVCLCLTMLEYMCDRQWMGQVLAQFGGPGWARAFGACCVQPANPLGRNVYWVLVNLACYLLLPLAVIRFVLRRPLADFGVRTQGALQAYPVYLLMLAVMLPLVWYASATGGFLARYPFLRLPAGTALWPIFLWWELLYCAQFFALEFFFRGFMLHGLAPRFGQMSVVVMTLPYCALHFGKPLPETLAAIIAGLVLGTLSLKSRSILLGALIHCSVALSMDGAALWRKGLFAV
jgi:membrane protease YdiL (CAAX protease family)